MEITIKNVKHSGFASRETHCFEATVYIDGKREFIVRNDGNGGCDDYEPLKAVAGAQNVVWERIKEINEELGKEKIECSFDDPKTGKPATLDNNLEIVIGHLVNQFLTDREIKKTLKKIAYVDADGAIYTVSAKHKPTSENLKSITNASWWNPENTILNTLPIEEVREYFQ